MNALDLLRNDHVRVSSLIGQVLNEINPATGQSHTRNLKQLSEAIHCHQKMLHEYFNKELEPFAKAHSLIMLNNHKLTRICELLDELESNQPPEQSWIQRLEQLHELWQTHMEEAETRLFPEAESLLGATRLQQLAYDMDSIRTHQSDQDSAIYPASRLGPAH